MRYTLACRKYVRLSSYLTQAAAMAVGRARRSSPLPKRGRTALEPLPRAVADEQTFSRSLVQAVFEGAGIIHAAQPSHDRQLLSASERRESCLSDGRVGARDDAACVRLAFLQCCTPIPHGAPPCRLRLFKAGRGPFECALCACLHESGPLVHVSSIFGPVLVRLKSWYDKGFKRSVILSHSARHSPGILTLLSDSGGNECPRWR